MRYFSSLRYLVVLLVLLCTACGTALPSIKPYKLDVQQGNVVTSKMLLQLRPGMTKSQVRFIMGTPLIQDSFHGNRWDYVYQMREAGKIIEQRRVILDFEKDLLKAVRGDVIPAGSAAPETERANTGTRLVEPYKKPEEKSLINKLKFWEKDEAAPAKAPEEKAPAAKADVKKVPELKAVEPKAAEQIKVDAVEQPAATDASPSMLAVPLAVPVAPSTEAAVAAPAAVASPAPVVEATPVIPEVVKQSEPEVVPQVAAPVESPVNSPLYESASGMVFDRKLRSLPEEVESDAVAAPAAPRVGNKVAPKPQDLPPENEPSFFDRMLEKIGF
ncbi:outer membrane protein assembly factor BamE [Methylotenera mobilis]|uniref:Outer membrane protein assembly factor BamE n=1 Tax=Methylotenera mobilis (strain JLW8 / ATCC BAA-1282 / DSM 17540) TaxID=583345 RepID=C6WXG4_METML|nr:outer membrane protein assembly factor BamE [Methylotenera mobilis]ACT48613.1 SmpA/OmlA domain protein [Methylotenera mobilis JLW8]